MGLWHVGSNLAGSCSANICHFGLPPTPSREKGYTRQGDEKLEYHPEDDLVGHYGIRL